MIVVQKDTESLQKYETFNSNTKSMLLSNKKNELFVNAKNMFF